jgi:hypothetical protein
MHPSDSRFALRARRGAALILATCLLPALAQAPRYEARHLWLDPRYGQPSAADLDNSGHAIAVLYLNANYGGVYWHTADAKPRAQELRTPRGGKFIPIRLNDEGYVAGAIWNATREMPEAAALGPDGHAWRMEAILPSHYDSELVGISRDGLAAGFYVPACCGGGDIRTFTWDRENGLVDLGLLHEGDTRLRAYGMNESGVVVGYGGGNIVDAFAWTADRGLVDISDSLPPSTFMEADDVNASGQVAVGDLGNRVGYVFDLATGGYSALPNLHKGVEWLAGIDARGDVVGVSTCDDDTPACPTVWRHEGAAWVAYDLHDITTWRGRKLGTLTYAAAINDAGQILAADSQDVYLLTPR